MPPVSKGEFWRLVFRSSGGNLNPPGDARVYRRPKENYPAAGDGFLPLPVRRRFPLGFVPGFGGSRLDDWRPESFFTPETICFGVIFGPDGSDRCTLWPLARILTEVPPMSTTSTFLAADVFATSARSCRPCPALGGAPRLRLHRASSLA
jgi:hypothetical protein